MASHIPTTSWVQERLLSNVLLRYLCGWPRPCDVPSASTHSRAFEDLSEAKLPTKIHEALIKNGHAGEQVWHISRDSTAIKDQQKSAPKKQTAIPVKKRKRGCPEKEKARPGAPRRLEKQLTMELEQMLEA